MAAIESLVRESRIVALDRDGKPASTGLVLPFLVTGLDVADGEPVVTGTRPEGPAVVAGLDLDRGAIAWTAELPPLHDLTRVPEPVATTTGIAVLWQSGFDRTTIWLSEVAKHGVCAAESSARHLELDDLTSDSAVAAVGHRVALARVHGERQQLDVLWLDDGEVVGTAPVAERVGSASPSMGALPGTTVVAWDDGDGLRVSRIEVGAHQSAAELHISLRPSEHRSCDVITGLDGRVAVIWHVIELGDPQPLEGVPGRWEPTELVESWVATLDTEAWRLTAPVRLDPPGTLHATGGWVGRRLVLVHGDQQPIITVLEQAV